METISAHAAGLWVVPHERPGFANDSTRDGCIARHRPRDRTRACRTRSAGCFALPHERRSGEGGARATCRRRAFPMLRGSWRCGVVLALGRVDVLVNNAGIFADHPPLTTDFTAWEAAWRRIIGANLLGPANLSLLAAQAMAAQPESQGPAWGRGRIVNISSRGAFRGEPDTPAYGASKAGLNSLSQSLAKALAARAVYVYCLAPGFVETDMAAGHLAGPGGADILAQHPLGRITMPDEVARTDLPNRVQRRVGQRERRCAVHSVSQRIGAGRQYQRGGRQAAGRYSSGCRRRRGDRESSRSQWCDEGDGCTGRPRLPRSSRRSDLRWLPRRGRHGHDSRSESDGHPVALGRWQLPFNRENDHGRRAATQTIPFTHAAHGRRRAHRRSGTGCRGVYLGLESSCALNTGAGNVAYAIGRWGPCEFACV